MTTQHEKIGQLLEELDANFGKCLGNWNAYREKIVDLASGNNTEEESITVILMHKLLLDGVESAFEFEEMDLLNFRKIREGEYKLLLIIESSDESGNIIPKKYHQVIEREVEAGRISQDDELRRFAEDSAIVLGDTYEKLNPPKKSIGMLGKLFGKRR